MNTKYEILFKWLSYLIYLTLVLITLNYSFFWDTVQLGSSHAHFFYENQFNELLLPNNIDSGHIPIFGAYHAVLWTIFRKSLVVSHLGMLPFAIGIVYQIQRLTSFIFREYTPYFIAFLILLDPTLLAQVTLISPDVPLIFCFLWCLNSILRNQKYMLMIGMVFLFLISLRGFMIAFCLLLFDCYKNIDFKQNFKEVFSQLVKRSILYIPALLIAGSYLYYHWSIKGWIGFHSDSPWAGSFEKTDFKGFFKNIIVYGWRLLDFGKIIIWIICGVLILKFRIPFFKDKKQLSYFILFLIFAFILPINMLWAKNLLGHRYLIPIYLVISLFTLTLLYSQYVNKKWRKQLSILWIIVIITGNLWVYPAKISQGSDASLAYLPYDGLRKDAIKFLDKEKISFSEVASFFPNKQTGEITDLNGKIERFRRFDGKELPKFVFYSNLYNLTDEELDVLSKEYIVYKEFSSITANVLIYKKINQKNVQTNFQLYRR